MPLLKERPDALLYLLDFMVGIDEHLDPNESELFVERAFAFWPGDFERVHDKIQWIAQLWREHDRDQLLDEACRILLQHNTVEEDLALLRKMAAVDGVIDPREQDLFNIISKKLGREPSPLTL
ncbi:MAG: TerB family tellurite resistance protein [Deltaproteobacteria bacterium]|nr:MAG: TerB family tellurite resistance protein [Deltaproteobacteria bacterium]